MKKLLLIAALAFSCVAMNAQDSFEGKWFVGGQFGYNHVKEKMGDFSAKGDTYTILPTIGTFISSDVAVGASLGYEGSKADKAKTNQMVIAPLVRKYWNISGGLYVFGQASLPIAFGDKNYGVDEDGEPVIFEKKAKTLGVHVELSPGFDYIFNDKFSVETSFNVLSLGYGEEKQGEAKTTRFGLNANKNGGSKFGELRIGFKMLF